MRNLLLADVPLDHVHRLRLILLSRMTDAVDAGLSAVGSSLIIDVHSFSSVPSAHEPDQDPIHPEICIGLDSFHSPLEEGEAAVRIYEKAKFTVKVNRPFSGTMLPVKIWAKTREVRSLVDEVRRDLYMNEKTGERLPEFEALFSRACNSIVEFVASADQTFQ
jgi:N-formylglutamate amidohydrolase